MSPRAATLVFVLTLAFLGCFLIWPVWQILRGGLGDSGGFSLAYLGEVFLNPIYRQGLLNALGLAFCTTVGCLLVAVPLAWLYDRYDFPGRSLLGGAILLPMILPPFVGAIGMRQILGQEGALNAGLRHLGLLAPEATIDWLGQGQFWGVVAVCVLSLYPILYLNALAALGSIDPTFDEAAQNLGARGWRRFWRVTLPLMRPGLFAGGTVVFIWSFTELGVPLMFDYSRLTAVQIFYGIKDLGSSPFPFALVIVMLVVATGIYVAGRLLWGRQSHATVARAGSLGGVRPAGWGARLLCWAAFGLVGILALLPHLGVILTALAHEWYGTVLPESWTLENFRLALGHPLAVPSIANSLLYASLATLLNLLLGIAIAVVLVRTRIPGCGLLDALAMLPLAVPGLVVAFGYLAMTQEGRAFDWLNPVVNPTALLVIAYAVRKLPLVVRSAVAGLHGTSATYEEAAINLGATPLRALLRITLPLIIASLLAGGLLAFSQAMLEVSDSLLLAQRAQDYPITKAIYELMQFLGDGKYLASALGVWAMVFLGICLLGVSALLGRKLGAVFRL